MERKSRSFSTPNRFGWIGKVGKVGLIYRKFRFIGLFIAPHLFTSRRFSVFYFFSFRIFTHPKISECLNIRQVIFSFQFGRLCSRQAKEMNGETISFRFNQKFSVFRWGKFSVSFCPFIEYMRMEIL